MIRLNPPGLERLERACTLQVRIGGSESNTAIALTKLGRRAAWWSRLIKNPLGRRIEADIRSHGVDVSGVIWSNSGRVGVYFLEYGAPPRGHEVYYDRANSAASQIAPEDIDPNLLTRARHLHATGITAALSPSCAETVIKALEMAKQAGLTTSLDVNFRRKLWSPESARITLERAMPNVDLLISPLRDSEEVFATKSSARDTASELQQRYGLQRVVVTAGADGAFAVDGDAALSASAVESGEVDRVGTGDAFDAGVIHGFLDDDLATGLRTGCSLAALKRTIPGDVLITSQAEIEATTGAAAHLIRR